MKVPNAGRAVVDIAKLRHYSLEPAHEEGKHKARVVAAALWLTQADADWLRQALLEAVSKFDCELGKLTPHGQRYLVDFPVSRDGRSTRLRTVWNIRQDEDFPRLVTRFVL